MDADAAVAANEGATSTTVVFSSSYREMEHAVRCYAPAEDDASYERHKYAFETKEAAQTLIASQSVRARQSHALELPARYFPCRFCCSFARARLLASLPPFPRVCPSCCVFVPRDVTPIPKRARTGVLWNEIHVWNCLRKRTAYATHAMRPRTHARTPRRFVR